jgi:hypothetical protein
VKKQVARTLNQFTLISYVEDRFYSDCINRKSGAAMIKHGGELRAESALELHLDETYISMAMQRPYWHSCMKDAHT